MILLSRPRPRRGIRPLRTSFRVFAPIALLALAALAGTGCSSTPAAYLSAGRLQVSYVDFRTGSRFMLINDDVPEHQDLYSRPRGDAAVKLAPRETLLDVVEGAAEQDFFDYAQDTSGRDAITDEMRDDAYGVFTIAADDESHSFVFERGIEAQRPGAAAAFTEITRSFLDAYNRVNALQFIAPGKADGRIFDREQERLRRENEDRLRTDGGR